MERHHSIGLVLAVIAGASCVASAASDSDYSSAAITEPARGGLPPYFATVDVTGIPSEGALGSGSTTVLSVWVGPSNIVIGVGWDVTIQSIWPTSWLADIGVLVTNSANEPFTGFGLTPGGDDGFPGGPTMYSSNGLQSLDNFGIPPLQVLSDGFIRLEFFELYVDAPGEVEGVWEGGDLYFQTVNPIPDVVSPGSGCIVIAQGLFLIRRRRTKVFAV